MTPNNNLNVLPCYSDNSFQDYLKKDYSFGKSFDLLCHSSFLLPFQYKVSYHSDLSVASIHLVNANDMSNVDITSYMASLFTFKHFTTYSKIIYTAKTPIPYTIKEGRYYLTIASNHGDVIVTEIFTVVNDVSNLLKIEYWDSANLEVGGDQIDYTFPFRNFLYLDTQLAKPDYSFEEVVEKRDGYSFIESQISSKLYKFLFLAPEFLLDAMRIIRLHDHIRITNLGDIYEASTFLITPKWTDRGYLATVDAEFETGTVIKKLGKAIPYTEMGDFNNDYSHDFNNG